MTCNLYILEADVKGIVSAELSYKQPVLHSPKIEAVVEISEIVDQWTVLAKSALTSESIIVEFSYPQEFPVGSRVLIIGELSFGEMIPWFFGDIYKLVPQDPQNAPISVRLIPKQHSVQQYEPIAANQIGQA